MKIAPSLLHTDIDEFAEELNLLKSYFRYYQIDVTDGKFVPSKTIQLAELIAKKAEWMTDEVKKLYFDFDLMVEDYEKALSEIEVLSKNINVRNVFIHFKALKERQLPKNPIFTIGVALDPSDTVNALDYQIGLTNTPVIQIMSVEPGLQGSPFIAKMLTKITQLRLQDYKSDIFLDGGINDVTIRVISSHKYKPDWLGPGSFLSNAGDKLIERVEYLKKIEEKG